MCALKLLPTWYIKVNGVYKHVWNMPLYLLQISGEDSIDVQKRTCSVSTSYSVIPVGNTCVYMYY